MDCEDKKKKEGGVDIFLDENSVYVFLGEERVMMWRTLGGGSFLNWKQNCNVQQLWRNEMKKDFFFVLLMLLSALFGRRGSEEAEGVLANIIISGVATPTSITLQFKQNKESQISTP